MEEGVEEGRENEREERRDEGEFTTQFLFLECHLCARWYGRLFKVEVM